jgi:hypothetical protein
MKTKTRIQPNTGYFSNSKLPKLIVLEYKTKKKKTLVGTPNHKREFVMGINSCSLQLHPAESRRKCKGSFELKGLFSKT